MTGVYFDDNITLDLVAGAASSQRSLRYAYHLIGTVMSPSKHVPMHTHRAALGKYSDLSIFSRGYIIMDVTEAFRRNLIDFMQNVLDQQLSHPAQASKIRGCLGWSETREWGKVGRVAQRPLIIQQYYKNDPSISADLEDVLRFSMVLLD